MFKGTAECLPEKKKKSSHVLTYCATNSMGRALLEKLVVTQLVKFPYVYGA
jgi:hypothetical protein